MQLIVDSSGQYLVAGLGRDGSPVHEVALPATSLKARNLLGVVSGLLDAAQLRPEMISQVGVGVGPGSFIGTRAAVCFANGFAAARKLPVFPLPTLAAWAAVVEDPLSVLRDARRGEVYLYDPRTDQTTLLRLDGLQGRLTELGTRTVIAEASVQDDDRSKAWRDAVETAAITAQISVCWQPHVPAAGLLKLLAKTDPQRYAEPLYLRGFL
jgi:tRNA threonylcarbamoyl adenosine modification protein YeaZ